MPEPEKLLWRSDLGWTPYSPAGRADPKRGLVIHYDGSNQRLASKPHSACVAYWKRTREFHVNGRGWADLGYSWGACPHSYVFEGRGLYRYQAAQGTTAGNRDYYSVTLMCGPSDEITPGQINAVRQLREWLMEPATSIAGTVRGHRDFVPTSCPGDAAYRMVRDGTFARPAVWGDEVPRVERPDPQPERENPARGTVPGPKHEFPLPDGHYFGPRSGPNESVSGYYGRTFNGRTDREWLREFGKQLARRGWPVGEGEKYLTRYGNDGLYGSEYAALVRAFQRSQGLAADALIGPDTWREAFHRPVT